MKTHKVILALVAIAAALFTTLPAHAAKGERKRDRNKDATPDFAALDKDGNGSISKAEYVAGMKAQLGEEAAAARFADLDKNKDGSLSKEELGTAEKKKKREKKTSAN